MLTLTRQIWKKKIISKIGKSLKCSIYWMCKVEMLFDGYTTDRTQFLWILKQKENSQWLVFHVNFNHSNAWGTEEVRSWGHSVCSSLPERNSHTSEQQSKLVKDFLILPAKVLRAWSKEVVRIKREIKKKARYWPISKNLFLLSLST